MTKLDRRKFLLVSTSIASISGLSLSTEDPIHSIEPPLQSLSLYGFWIENFCDNQYIVSFSRPNCGPLFAFGPEAGKLLNFTCGYIPIIFGPGDALIVSCDNIREGEIKVILFTDAPIVQTIWRKDGQFEVHGSFSHHKIILTPERKKIIVHNI